MNGRPFCIAAIVLCLHVGHATLAADQPAAAPPDAAKTDKVLIYEVDPQSKTNDKSFDMRQLTTVVDRRINTGWLRVARIEALPGERLQITVLRATEERVKRAARAIEAAGTLEFRILAHERDHKELIERAKKDDAENLYDPKDESKDKKWIAKWIPVHRNQEANFAGAGYDGIARRERKLPENRKQTEILVVRDDFDVTGDYLTGVRAAEDERQKPCLYFSLDKKGGALFQGLTSTHLPKDDGAFTYKLGILLDGCLFSAPSIQSTISDRGQITGQFTKEEVDELANVLNAGALPVKLNRVDADGK